MTLKKRLKKNTTCFAKTALKLKQQFRRYNCEITQIQKKNWIFWTKTNFSQLTGDYKPLVLQGKPEIKR